MEKSKNTKPPTTSKGEGDTEFINPGPIRPNTTNDAGALAQGLWWSPFSA